MEYYIWTPKDLESLTLGDSVSSVCTEAQHEICIRANRGCSSVLKGAYTIRDPAERERVAKAAQEKCRKVKVVIVEEPENKPPIFFKIGGVTCDERRKEIMANLESEHGLSDFHAEVHLSDKESVRFENFVLAGIHPNGRTVFTARGAMSVDKTVKLIASAIESEVKTLATMLSITHGEVATLINEDRLMEEIEKRFRGKG